ncbi:uncharacterized protein LOC124913393 [Impatiens glandulifera]|uniref:uncharacterized protein LOC124913393 n=1 Tax=Impatiens glandulifera TaxID=253017 RepID=UPI001FB10652|nr:uncharacterized protein LOC124913393 [Impatiens glandulifera]
MSLLRKIFMFTKKNYDKWKIRMQAHLASLDDDMWYVITDGPMKIMKANSTTTSDGTPLMKEKPMYEWTSEEKRNNNLENMAKDILYKTLDNNMFSKIKACFSAKEIWEKLTQLYEGNEQPKQNKLMVVTHNFEKVKMRSRETMTEFDERFSIIVIELLTLGKTYRNREVVTKVLRALPRE